MNYQDKANRVTFIQGDPSNRQGVSVGTYGQWHHVVGTCMNKMQFLYHDGRQVAEWPAPLRPTISSEPVRIGGDAGDTSRSSRVSIDAVRLYNYALSPKEVATRYLAGQLPRD